MVILDIGYMSVFCGRSCWLMAFPTLSAHSSVVLYQQRLCLAA